MEEKKVRKKPFIEITWKSGSTECYKDFKKKHKDITLTYAEWKNIVYIYNDAFRLYMLETGEQMRMPMGLGMFAITKKSRRIKVGANGEFIGLSVDWQKTKKLGKRIYNMNRDTDGYFFGWRWFKHKSIIANKACWYFKAGRTTSRLITHYVRADKVYQHRYKNWNTIKMS